VIHLRTLRYNPPTSADIFPFNVPPIRALEELTFPEVTFFVGENGSGKSTLLEALAAAVGSITVGADGVDDDPTLIAARKLGEHLRLTWNIRTRKGFFLRSEDFFGYTKRMAQIKAGLEADMRAVDEEYKGRSDYAKGLAKMSYGTELADLQRRYGEGLDSYSHGESYFTLFRSRFVPGGLYLLDEPEAPLSPMRQLTLLSMIKQMVEEHEAQFIIATHSPILMAYPDAAIYSFDGGAVQPVEYETLEHVTLTRAFLANPAQFLRHL
jgi:predicted ATPase